MSVHTIQKLDEKYRLQSDRTIIGSLVHSFREPILTVHSIISDRINRNIFSYDTRSYDFRLISRVVVQKKTIQIHYNTLHHFYIFVLLYENFRTFSNLFHIHLLLSNDPVIYFS